MGSPRNRYVAVIQTGDIHLNGIVVPFRSRTDEVEERLQEALRDYELEDKTSVLVLRYTQMRSFKIGGARPAGWIYDLKSAPTGEET